MRRKTDKLIYGSIIMFLTCNIALSIYSAYRIHVDSEILKAVVKVVIQMAHEDRDKGDFQ